VTQFEFKTVIHTDTTRDGMLSGTNLTALVDLATAFPHMEFIASGGVATISDITNLLNLNLPNLIGVIIGKALYEQRISLSEAIKVVTGFQRDSDNHKNNGN
ncbi:MAG: HisA/HisF-related TIM barrel protein, partial [Candidatus Sumerlaeia bacterium]|nr:HisA/HisF-related TIM barrel protein [Candidatus Sumerlaeia bacterium]